MTVLVVGVRSVVTVLVVGVRSVVTVLVVGVRSVVTVLVVGTAKSVETDVVGTCVGTNVGKYVGFTVGLSVVVVVVVVVLVVVSSTYSVNDVGAEVESDTGLLVCHGPLECVGFSVGEDKVVTPPVSIKSIPLDELLISPLDEDDDVPVG